MKIIKFGKEGCSPCEQVSKFLKSNKVVYEDINPLETDDVDLILKHNIRNVPVTLLLDNDGEVVQRNVGYNETELKQLIDKYNND